MSVAASRYDFEAELPHQKRTLNAIWRSRVDESASREFLWFPRRGYVSYGDLDRRAASFRVRLASGGIGHGSRVCLLMRNSPEMLASMLAVWSLGGVVVPLNFQLKGVLLKDLTERVDPSLLVIDAELAEHVSAELRSDLGDRLWTSPDDLAADAGHSLRLEMAEVEPWSLALILYTSGSTGPSKGCMLTHQFCSYYAWVFWRYMGYAESDVLFTCLPLYHTHALFASAWPAILAGARLAIAPHFTASGFTRQLHDSGATAFGAMGTMASILLAQPRSELEVELNLRLAHIAPCPPRLQEFESRFGVKVVSSLYGLTEAMIFPPQPSDPPEPGKLGRNPPDWEVAIVDPNLQPEPDGIAGELVARPRIPGIIFEGYHGRPEDTVKAFRGLWYHTGDICRRDSSGTYWFVGRAGDVIRRRGENVSTYELEKVLGEHIDVKEIAALGLHSSLGEDDIAVVAVLRPGAQLSEDAFRAWAEDILPRYMRPDVVRLLDTQLPKLANGKIDKATLADQLTRGD